MNRRQIHNCTQLLRQELALDTRLAAKAAAIVVVLLLLPLLIIHLPHLPLSQWLPFAVDSWAEGVMLFSLVWPLLTVIGLIRFLGGHTCLQALTLLGQRLRDLVRIPATHRQLSVNLDKLVQWQVSVIWRWLRQHQCAHPPGVWSRNRAPLLLFLQTPLLLAP